MAENEDPISDNSSEKETSSGGGLTIKYGAGPYFGFMYQNPHFSWSLPFLIAIFTYGVWLFIIIRRIKGSK